MYTLRCTAEHTDYETLTAHVRRTLGSVIDEHTGAFKRHLHLWVELPADAPLAPFPHWVAACIHQLLPAACRAHVTVAPDQQAPTLPPVTHSCVAIGYETPPRVDDAVKVGLALHALARRADRRVHFVADSPRTRHLPLLWLARSSPPPPGRRALSVDWPAGRPLRAWLALPPAEAERRLEELVRFLTHT